VKSLTLVVLAVALSLAACADDPRPTDAALIAQLRAKMPLFRELVAMIEQDRDLERVDVDWTRPDDPATIGVTPERIAIYRKLMTEAGVPRGFYALKPRKAITFIAYASGLFTHGWAKNYVYLLPGAESERYGFDLEEGDLDAAAAGEKKYLGYRHIEGNWYLQLDSY
jgi:hypothetical protein